MDDIVYDIIIVGAGPAGSYLGYLLAKNGLHPVIFDHSHPREKPCGGGITAFALERFQFIQEISENITPENEMEIISHSGISVMTRGEKSSLTVSRATFDKYLLDKAVESGSIWIPERVIDVKLKDDIWEVKTKKGKYYSRLIVGADGVDSIVRKRILGPIPKEDIGVCYGCYAVSKRRETPVMKFLGGKEGYAWCAPRRDHLSIGIGTNFSYMKNIKNMFKNFISSHYPHVEIISRWGAKIPNVKNPKFYSLPCAGDNWILIGDAAGHVDPITGDGISYALWDAELSSEAIIKKDPKSFDLFWRKSYSEKLISGCKMRRLFYNRFLIENLLKISSKSTSLSAMLYDIVNSKQDYQSLPKRIIMKSPRIIKEYLISYLEKTQFMD
ncbi:MAG: NAD(P)/FAD-dependent oxidoreductase [Candidatus Thermoplasmatota archaeon]